MALGSVEDEAQRSVLSLDSLALHDAARVDDVLHRRLRDLEERVVEEKPGEHLLVAHGLREMIDGNKPGIGGLRALGRIGRFEVDVPQAVEAALAVDEIEEASAHA